MYLNSLILNKNVNISQVSTKMHYDTDSWNSKDWTFILIFEVAGRNLNFKENSNSWELQCQHVTRNKAIVWSNKNQKFTWSKKLWMIHMWKFTWKITLILVHPTASILLIVSLFWSIWDCATQAEWPWIKSGFCNVPMLSLHMCFVENNCWPPY